MSEINCYTHSIKKTKRKNISEINLIHKKIRSSVKSKSTQKMGRLLQSTCSGCPYYSFVILIVLTSWWMQGNKKWFFLCIFYYANLSRPVTAWVIFSKVVAPTYIKAWIRDVRTFNFGDKLPAGVSSPNRQFMSPWMVYFCYF